MTPLDQIIRELACGQTFICSKLLFAIINRTLNDHGHRANVNWARSSEHVLEFTIVENT